MENNQITNKELVAKIAVLRGKLNTYRKVAIAFSGGVDFTVLLDNCCKVFKPENIIALHARSCLQSGSSVEMIEEVVRTHFYKKCTYRVIMCNPLEWVDFVQNTDERCYFCKKKTYSVLIKEAEIEGCDVLFDGTNTNDLGEYRPGLRAVREHGVVSPFVVADISKSDIRQYAKGEGLINHDLPSNSCLATRIATNKHITIEMLEIIDHAETFLLTLGFAGVRVRPEQNRVCVEVMEKDVTRIMDAGVRERVVRYFRAQGLGLPYVGMLGR